MSFVEHSYSVHCEKVNCMCRICSERVRRQIKGKLMPLKLCATYIKELNIYHGLDTTHDKQDEHPKGMCTKYYQRLVSCKRASNCAKSDTKTASDHAAVNTEQSMYGPSSTQKYLPLNALHVATLTHNAKESNQKSSKLVLLKD